MKYLELKVKFICPDCGTITECKGDYETQNNIPLDEWIIECEKCDKTLVITVQTEFESSNTCVGCGAEIPECAELCEACVSEAQKQSQYNHEYERGNPNYKEWE